MMIKSVELDWTGLDRTGLNCRVVSVRKPDDVQRGGTSQTQAVWKKWRF
jgi:hypothetical protein